MSEKLKSLARQAESDKGQKKLKQTDVSSCSNKNPRPLRVSLSRADIASFNADLAEREAEALKRSEVAKQSTG